MRIHEEVMQRIRIPDDGVTIDEVYTQWFGLIAKEGSARPELHGHVVTMEGSVVVPELKPPIKSLFDGIYDTPGSWEVHHGHL